jgi:hypothetical protein
MADTATPGRTIETKPYVVEGPASFREATTAKAPDPPQSREHAREPNETNEEREEKPS